MFRNILAAYDDSRHSRAALERAVELARVGGARLTIISVAPLPTAWAMGGGATMVVDLHELQEDLVRVADQRLSEVVAELPDDIPVEKLVITGSPGQVIVDQLEAGDYDLVVIGSRGRGEIASLVLGSVSQHVVQRSPVPVLVVGADREQGDEG